MSTVDLLRTNAPHASEELRSRGLAARPAERTARRLRPALVLASAAALAIAAAVVHGVSTSAPTVRLQHGAAASSGSVTTQSWAAAPQRAATKDSFAPAMRGRLTHTDASIRVRVSSTDELGADTNRATRIATSLGGYAQSVVYRTPAG